MERTPARDVRRGRFVRKRDLSVEDVPKDVGEAMRNALAEAGAKRVDVIICRRENTNKVWKYVLAFAAQIRMQFVIWRARHPVVFQDSFCVANYPIRFFSAEKYFFAAANGKAEVLPT